MNGPSLLEWAIIAFIIISMVVIIWRGGAANPESTGRLGRKVEVLGKEVTDIDRRVKHVEEDVGELSKKAVTQTDLAALRAEMKGDRELAQRTFKSIDRIEHMLLEKGLSGK